MKGHAVKSNITHVEYMLQRLSIVLKLHVVVLHNNITDSLTHMCDSHCLPLFQCIPLVMIATPDSLY